MNTTPSDRDGDAWPQEQSAVRRPTRSGRTLRAAGIFAGGAVVAGALVGGANAWASTTSRASAATGYGSAAPGNGESGSPGAGSPGAGGPGGGASADATVTGAELAKVTAAMKAKDSAVTVTAVRKDPDGSYDVLGTKAGAPVFYDVSADLTTFTAGGGGRGGHGGGPGGGPGGSPDTAVTGDAAAKATAAVKAKDAAVTVTAVRKDPDGSYDVLGTKAGAPVMFDVSADLKTVTQNTVTPGQAGPGQQAPSGSSEATPSSTA
jgi:hypothetical protein